MKYCTKCEIEKDDDAFGWRTARWHNNRVIKRNWCKTCHCAEAKARTDKNRTQVTLIKESTPCMDCSLYFRGYVMEHHHRPDEIKIADISKMCSRVSDFTKIQAEIDKCDLLCANCHRERTHGNH